MKSARHLVGRSLTWLAIGVVVFTGVLATLPVPQAADGPARGVPEETFAIVDVTAFDGEAFRQGWDVWVEDGRIRHAGQKLDLPEDLPRLDGRGHTLIPGLIDGHVHSFLSTLRDALRFGVTTVLDQSTDPAFAAAQRPAREEVARGTEADLFSAGMTATAPEGHGTQYGIPVETLTGPDEATEWVRARKTEGSDWIKIIYEDGSAFDMEIPSLDGETVAAVIAAAHAEGLAAVVHVSTLETALEAMAFGADGLVHVWRDEVVSEADARRFREAGIFVVPTLSVMVSADDSALAALVRETDETMLSPIQRQTLDGRFSGGLAEGGDVAMENVRRLRAAGVRLVAGTDSPNPGTGAGISMHGELRLLARAGMGNAEALAAATSVAADAFGIAGRGRIAEGRLADLVLVRGDLERDVSRSHDIVAIWKDGYLVDRAVGSAGAGPLAEIAPAPAETLVADFEDGFEARFGAWDVTTDQLTGGASSANAAVRDGALVVTGEIAPGLAFPWAGVIWMPGAQPMQPVDFSGREAIRFRTRGDGRQYSVMLISTAEPAGPPPAVTFIAPEEWTRLEIRLEDFPTATPEIIAGLAFVAEEPVGAYTFEVDEVEVR
ncbi:MAG: amidohydrolase family protein [Gemmatimonadetes bacterium]|nr:amidohydrolase family protein [Gemmatimonadota bacterium]MYG35293.1 amidohydrolase family protein [Gemmatimonadota bacterium]